LHKLAAATFRDRSRSARYQARQIADTASKRSETARTSLKQQYQGLIKTTQANLAQARQILPVLQAETSRQAERLVKTLETFMPRVEQVIQQTIQPVVEGQSVPAQDKLVSLFEPHTDIIRCHKLRKPTEFGHKIWLDEVDGGIVSDYRILHFILMTWIGWAGSYQAMIVVLLTIIIPFSVWMLKSFMDDVPIDLEEAALVDGANHRQAFFSITLPLALPGIIVTAMFAFVFSWNNVIFPLTLSKQQTATLPVGTISFFASTGVYWNQMLGLWASLGRCW
jgi:hypothetical protein